MFEEQPGKLCSKVCGLCSFSFLAFWYQQVGITRIQVKLQWTCPWFRTDGRKNFLKKCPWRKPLSKWMSWRPRELSTQNKRWGKNWATNSHHHTLLIWFRVVLSKTLIGDTCRFAKKLDAFFISKTVELRKRIDKTVARGQSDPTFMLQFGLMFGLFRTSLSGCFYTLISKLSLMG